MQEVVDLGLQDTLDDDGVLLVEWGDAVEALLPDDHLVVELTVPGESEERRVAIRRVGERWAGRWERLEQAMDTWRAG
jgi:tRNA A37 threonylcarbamoyladenosine biosynthesis protein TsaE